MYAQPAGSNGYLRQAVHYWFIITSQVYKLFHVDYKLLMLIQNSIQNSSFIQTDHNGKKLLLLVNVLEFPFEFWIGWVIGWVRNDLWSLQSCVNITLE